MCFDFLLYWLCGKIPRRGGIILDIFVYGEKEKEYLKRKDKRLGEAIDQIGQIECALTPDLFAALVNSIVCQRISSKAGDTILNRMRAGLGEITPDSVLSRSEDELQAFGITFKKAGYIRGVAEKVKNGDLDIASLREKSDEEVCAELVKLEGIGVWTAEMLMLFSLGRADILSFGDLAILRGMCMLYRRGEIPRPLFEKYRKRYSPYGSVASLYLWEIAGGAVQGMKIPAPAKTKRGAER
jgi:DNA-3-methyladenine glycosylase II